MSSFDRAHATSYSTLLETACSCVRFVDVAGGRGVDGRRAADDVGRSPTAAASGGEPPGTPLSERGNLGSYWCAAWFGINSVTIGMKLVGPNCGSIWPPGALRGTLAKRELSDPIPPSTPSIGADGGTASFCGMDSSFSAAVTGNLTGPELTVSGATSSGSTSLGMSETRLVLRACEQVKWPESIWQIRGYFIRVNTAAIYV